MNLRAIKPGWYVLLALLAYGLFMTFVWQRNNRALEAFRTAFSEPIQVAQRIDEKGLWFPIAGAQLPLSEKYLPGAPRAYRKDLSQGFTFSADSAGIPISYGTAVIASADAQVVRVDDVYRELTEESWRSLVRLVSLRDATEEEKDALRGRQIWLRTDDGLLLRYGHLSSIKPSLRSGDRVYRGQVIGFVGNSGTEDGVAGSTRGARLHFEVWDGNLYLGQALSKEEVLREAATLFIGP